jgi:hypothetical protein
MRRCRRYDEHLASGRSGEPGFGWRDGHLIPDAQHINALPEPVRRYIRDLETRADPAGDVAELALLKENNRALWNRVQELEDEVKHLADRGAHSTEELWQPSRVCLPWSE